MSNASPLPGDIAPRVVGIVAFDGVSTLDFLAPLEALKAARAYDNYHRAQSCYKVMLIGLTKTFVSESGLTFEADKAMHAAPALDSVIVPGGTGVSKPENLRAISGWLATRQQRVRRIAGVGGGIYPLAKSGLLDGRRVTTHWRFSHDVATRYPRLSVQHTAAFIRDGCVYTSGRGRAALEMTLALIQGDYGTEVALAVAEEFGVRLRPSGGDNTFAPPPVSEQDSAHRLASLPSWIMAHLEDDLSVDVLAQRTGLSPRHFSRLVKKTYKTTPAGFVEQLRLGEARRRLAVPGTTIKNVASAVGFRSADAFRRAFERKLGVTPRDFQLRLSRSVKRPPREARPHIVDLAA